MSDNAKDVSMGQVIKIDEARIKDHLGETVAEQLAELRERTGETLTDQLNDGAERHIRARRRQLSRD